MPIKSLKRCTVPLLILMSVLWTVSFQKALAFDMAIGHESGLAYGLGIAVSSVVKVKLLPATGIDMNAVVTANDQESLKALQAGNVAFAIAVIDISRPPSSPDIRALATLKRTSNRAITLLVRRDVDDGMVQTILEAILDSVDFIAAADQQAAGLTPDAALLGLAVPLHDGAKRFYMNNWASSGDTALTAVAKTPRTPAREAKKPTSESDWTTEPDDARNFILYFGFDDATLNNATRATLRDAATFAATLAEPAIIVAAYTDAAGDAEYNYLLAERRANAVMAGLDAFGVRYSRIDMSLFGERSPWAVTLDGVEEASNRRVELFIEEPIDEVQLLPVRAGFISDATPSSSESDRAYPVHDGNRTAPALPAGGPRERSLPSTPPRTLM